MLAYVAYKAQEGEILHPVVVVDEQSGIGGVAFEVEEFSELRLYALLVVAQSLLVDELALLALHGRVADHAGGASDKRYGPMSGMLEVTQHHNAYKVSDVQRIGGGIYAEVCCCHTFLEFVFDAGHDGVCHSAPFKFV